MKYKIIALSFVVYIIVLNCTRPGYQLDELGGKAKTITGKNGHPPLYIGSRCGYSRRGWCTELVEVSPPTT